MGMVCFGIISNIMRREVVSKYGVVEEDVCCMKTPCNYPANQLHFGCNYPCSLFQMDMAIEHWQKESQQDNNNVAIAYVAPNPIVKEAT